MTITIKRIGQYEFWRIDGMVFIKMPDRRKKTYAQQLIDSCEELNSGGK